MTVKYDAAALSTIKLLKGFGKFNQEYLVQIDKEMRGKGQGGANIIEKHFEKSPKRGGNIPKLEPKTIKQKKTKIKLVESGALKRATLKPRKPSIKGNKILFTAKVPDYGKHLTDGIPTKKGKKVFNFFNIFKNERGLFDRMAQSVFDFMLLSKGAK